MDEEQVWGKMLRPIWDMDGMTGPGDTRGEAFMRLLVPGTGDFSGEKCYTGDRVTEVVRAKESSGAEGNKSRGGYRRVCEG